MFLFLPCDTGRFPARPVVRPYVDIPSYSENATWKIVFPHGTGTRKSNLYDDRDDREDQKTPYVTLDAGEVFTGRACPGAFGGPEMIKVPTLTHPLASSPPQPSHPVSICTDYGSQKRSVE